MVEPGATDTEARKTFEPLLFTHFSLSAFKQGHLFQHLFSR